VPLHLLVMHHLCSCCNIKYGINGVTPPPGSVVPAIVTPGFPNGQHNIPILSSSKTGRNPNHYSLCWISSAICSLLIKPNPNPCITCNATRAAIIYSNKKYFNNQFTLIFYYCSVHFFHPAQPQVINSLNISPFLAVANT
jgi:hypothetical protein